MTGPQHSAVPVPPASDAGLPTPAPTGPGVTGAEESVAVWVDGPVATVELRGPGRGNALGPQFWSEMPGVFARLDADPQVRTVLLTGSGPHFCYGLDLAAMGAGFLAEPGLAGPRTAFLDSVLAMQDAITAVERCRKPVIAAVQGWCIGGGVDLIAACDIRLASADAQFSVREVQVAIVADMGSLQRLPALIGEGHTRRLALTGENISAARALDMGLISEVAADHAALAAAARSLADQIAALPPLAVQGTKRVLNDGRDLPRDAALRHVAVWNAAFLHSQDLGEAMTAFVERRSPTYRGH